MKHDFSSFGARLSKLRKKRHLTQKDLAKKVWSELFIEEVDPRVLDQKRRVICGYEKGTYPKDVEQYSRICEVLDCDMGYLFGEYQTSTYPEASIEEITGLSELAVENLYVASNEFSKGPLEDAIVNNPHDDLRSLEVGRIAKIRFLQVLLENSDLWERIAVCAYDYLDQMKMHLISPTHEVDGIRHDQFAAVAKEGAKEALSTLFTKMEQDLFET